MANTLKNYSKEGQKLPMFGVGPYLIYGIALLNAIVVILTFYVFHIGTVDGVWTWIFRIVGGVMIALGITFMWHNVCVLPMILVDWIILSVVLKNTEEKWLLEVYGEEYAEYKKRVNRCIPWKRQ